MASPLPASRDPFEGTPYRALRHLGDRAAGHVYLVEHRETDRRLAAKMLRQDCANDPRWVDRLRLEAQALGRLQHPHIVSIVALDTTSDGRPFVVTELLRGVPLSEELELRGGPLPTLDAIAYAWQLMAALAAAHRIGVVHRDVRPDNLFLCELPTGARILKVLDFGVARVLPGFVEAPAPLALPTEEGTMLSTPSYASPELLQGQAADPRSDVYAAGLVLYRMLVGRGPFDHARTEAELIGLQRQSLPPPSHLTGAPVPAELDRLVLRALDEDPRRRLQTADEACVALEEIGQALAGPVGWAETMSFDPEALALPERREQRSVPSPADPPAQPSRIVLGLVFVVVAIVAMTIASVLR